MIEGVDYSSTANADWAGIANTLKANGNRFVGRYAVNDKSPNGRGISGEEYAAMKQAGVDVFLYWESSEGWMTGGFSAGVAAAQNAQWNIEQAGMPQNTPVYFACDFDATPEQQAAIDDCLRGAASIIGLERVGIYAGFHIVRRCHDNGTARWFCQTLAWSGGQWFAGNHLEQYGFNRYLYGTNCDDVRAMQENYGQATPPAAPNPTPTPTPLPNPTPAPKPGKWAKKTPITAESATVVKFGRKLTATKATTPRNAADPNAPATAPDFKPGDGVTATWLEVGSDGQLWGVGSGGSRFLLSAFQ